MNGFLRLILLCALSVSLTRCVTNSASDRSEDDSSVEQAGSSEDDFADDELNAPSNDGSKNAGNTDEALDEEFESAEGGTAPAPDQNVAGGDDEFSQFEDETAATPPPAQPAAPVEEAPAPDINAGIDYPTETVPAPVEEPAPLVAQPAEPPVIEQAPPPTTAATPSSRPVKVTGMKYQANDAGGTLVIEGNAPLAYETRFNEKNNQMIVEIPNSTLAPKLKRSLNTRDMKGGIGAIDAYQARGSTVSRIVIQMRPGAAQPTVEADGYSLMVVDGSAAQKDVVEEMPEQESQILSSQSLEEFLSGNTQFYGKKISLEVSELDVREVFKLISEESGANLVLADEVKGSISVKLKQVPWDQALVVIMKAKKLGYTRAGNILRIAPLSDIKAEEDASVQLANAKKAQSPLKVKLIPVSYAKVEDLQRQVQTFLTERGKVVPDSRTNSIVVTDVEESLERVMKLVSSIDIPPQQVLIEGKVVEAGETFQKSIGINWDASGRSSYLGNASNARPIRGGTSFAVSPGKTGASALGMSFNVGTLDVLGNLSATLALFEQQDQLKVLSSPRIVTMHNEAAEINQNTQIPLISTNNNTTGGGTTTSVTFKDVKLKLSVTPQITNDAAVIMAVDVNRDSVGAVVDPSSQARSINTKTAKTKVMVKNGQTAVIGGIYQSDSQVGEVRVPWLGEIPILGWLFKNRQTSTQKNELLIFLTPRILAQSGGQAAPAEGGEF